MSVEILTIIIAILFVSMIYMGTRLDRMNKHLNIVLNQGMINSAIVAMLSQALIDKKLLTQADLVFLKQEEVLEQQAEDAAKNIEKK